MISLPSLRAKLEAATPGPWSVEIKLLGEFGNVRDYQLVGPCLQTFGAFGEASANADSSFIIAANPETLRVLLDALESARWALWKITMTCDHFDGSNAVPCECSTHMHLDAERALAAIKSKISFKEMHRFTGLSDECET